MYRKCRHARRIDGEIYSFGSTRWYEMASKSIQGIKTLGAKLSGSLHQWGGIRGAWKMVLIGRITVRIGSAHNVIRCRMARIIGRLEAAKRRRAKMSLTVSGTWRITRSRVWRGR
jgi:hypothetical protein